ncbi:hypothetical protein [Nocardia terpenica]|uniref:Uncharacterized protein n=1 Tax=Nocardia terpenica TaxID=455432 RepID=A0A6G9ZB39_9NOCA|nr:hypothetical protein [Nocardia terpenica]QIS22768.1 hypothetical protein F6W96_34970 [Nocardia terpenica]
MEDAGNAIQQEKLTTVRAEITDTNSKIDRYLTPFETGSLDPEPVSLRLTGLRDTSRQLTARRDELIATIDNAPILPAPAMTQRHCMARGRAHKAAVDALDRAVSGQF